MVEAHVLNVIDLILLISGVVSLILGFLVWIRGSRRLENIAYVSLSVGVFIWISNLVLFNRFIFGAEFSFWFAVVAYVGGLFIPISSLYFVTYFGGKPFRNRHLLHALSSLFIVIASLTLVPGLVIEGVGNVKDIGIIVYGPLYIPYALYLSGVFVVGFFYLWRRYRRAKGRARSQIKYFFIGAIIPASIAMVTNILLPYFGNFTFFMVGPAVMVVMTTFIGYAIIKYGLWDFRKILAEIFVSILIVLALFNIIVSPNDFSILAILVFKLIAVVVTAFAAVLLLNSFKKEQKQRKKLKKLNKQLKDMDEKKTEFLHIATHQLRGPITAIKGYTSLLQDGDYGKMTGEINIPLKKIMSASKVMTETINDYMDIARIEEKNLQLAPEEFKLCSLVRERVEIARVSAEERGLKLVLAIEGDHECTVHADKKSITQVVNALIENAIKYTKKGTITVGGNKSKDSKMATVWVKDSGIGVPKSEMESLFDKFSRASNAKESSVNGTGMGLFIAKSLMEANGGTIAVSSEGENKGTTFTAELPVVG